MHNRGGGLAFSVRCLINRIPDLARIAFAFLNKIGGPGGGVLQGKKDRDDRLKS